MDAPVELSDPNVTVVPAHGMFPEARLTFPIDWATNPFANPLWSHHFLSLRWIFAGEPQKTAIFRVLNDFLSYHSNPYNKFSEFYLGSRADHTAAIRLRVFMSIIDDYVPNAPSWFSKERFFGEVIFLLRLLASDALYRERSNHGLQVDLAVLTFLAKHSEYRDKCPPARVYESRALSQLDWLFAADGVTREHSVSYQEYNLDLCVQILDDLAEGGGAKRLCDKARSVLETATPFLAWCWKPTGEYAALGDSFDRPNNARVNRIAARTGRYGSYLRGLFNGTQEPAETGMKLYAKSGFGFIRLPLADDRPSSAVHLAFTCNYNSVVHKQNDETSFTLTAFGHSIIDDPGFSDVLTHEETSSPFIRSENNHSVLTLKGRPWRTGGVGKSIIFAGVRSQDALGFAAEHNRIEGCAIRRYVFLLRGRTLVVFDEIDAGEPCGWTQTFIAAPGVQPHIEDRGIALADESGSVLARLRSLGVAPVEPFCRPTKVVKSGRLVETMAIGFSGETAQPPPVSIELHGPLKPLVVAQIERLKRRRFAVHCMDLAERGPLEVRFKRAGGTDEAGGPES